VATSDAVRRLSARSRELALRILDVVPPLRRTVQELLRVEVVDRSMVVAAQALFALIPLVVVLAAFLPAELTRSGVERFEDVTGLSQTSGALVTDQVEPLVADESIRAQTGVVGLLVVILSSSSFARAVMRTYERIWSLPRVGAMRSRRLSLGWLLGWLVGLQLLALIGSLVPDALPIWLKAGVKVGVAGRVWWWTLHTLLSARVPWRPLAFPAFVTGAALVAYTAGSVVVMPRYAVSSIEQFGTFGLVLAVATWLVGIAGVMIVAAVVGRVLVEDPWVRRLVAYARGARRPAARARPPRGS
jgi:membrane protein